jgi:hypothetical protein
MLAEADAGGGRSRFLWARRCHGFVKGRGRLTVANS